MGFSYLPVGFFWSSAGSSALTPEEYLKEELSKFVTSEHVDQKVGSWVDSQHQVWNWNEDLQRERGLASGDVVTVVAKESFKNVGNNFEALAKNEHDHNADQNHCHIFVLFLLTSSGLVDLSGHFLGHALPLLHGLANSERKVCFEGSFLSPNETRWQITWG